MRTGNRSVTQIVQAVFRSVLGPGVTPPEIRRAPQKFGDYAINCAPMAKSCGQDSTILAENLAVELSRISEVCEAATTGSYINFRLRPEALFGEAVQTAAAKNAKGTVNLHRIMVEFLSPNTNKPIHVGHLRNATLGSAVANILSAAGHDVVKACLVNDRGVHICKSMLAWQMFANGQTPDSLGKKGDHFVGDWYVRYNKEAAANPALEEATTEMLRKWEDGDPETLKLWMMMNQWVYAGFSETYARYGYSFDRMYYESDLYKLGKDLVQDGLDRKVFETNAEGHVVFRLDPEQFGLSKEGQVKYATVIRADGTSVYLTQDVGTAVRKVTDCSLDRSIYVVATEQIHHFQVLFAILKALGFEWADKCFHLSYGMVELPDGKMKSRTGNVVDADDLLDEMKDLAEIEVRSRHLNEVLGDREIDRRAEVIALAAIKFYLLQFGAQTKIKFDRKKSLAFEGDTGPYCLYAYARARSIISRAAMQGLQATASYDLLGSAAEERTLAMNLLEIPSVIQRSAENYNPTIVAAHSLELAKSFNAFYQNCPVLGTNDSSLTGQRLALVQATAEGLKWTLSLLGIEVLEAM